VRSYSAGEEKIARLILGGGSATLTSSLVIWYLGSPTEFIEHRLGINSEAFDSVIPWLLALTIVVGYVSYTVKAILFVRQHLFNVSWLKIISIWAVLVLSIMEEIVFRQMLMDGLMGLNLGVSYKF